MVASTMEVGMHARNTFTEIEAAGPAARPLEFTAAVVHRGMRVNSVVIVNPSTGARQIFRGVVHREPNPDSPFRFPTEAYWPQRQLQEAIYGSVWACLVLRRVSRTADVKARVEKAEREHRREKPPHAEVVWEVTNYHVAIKMVEWSAVRRLRGRHIEDPIKEVAAMQLIGTGSPHVLGSREVLQDDHYLYSVMRYCKGGDLFGVVISYSENATEESEERMPEPMVRYWFIQILQGLHYLQTKGTCHRDLSLENILVDDKDSLVIDMGMCLRTPYSCPLNPGSVTDVTTGTIRRLIKPQGTCGKHNYMSPEIFQNSENFDGFAIDLWAAGIILYIMLTGFPPYDQASLVDQRFELIVTGHLVEQLDEWGVEISRDAGDLLQRMLQLDPRHRLTLADVMEHRWVTNPNVQPPPPAEPEGWRNR